MSHTNIFSRPLAILLLVLALGTASAQQYATFDVTPSVVDATLTFSIGDPFSVTVGAFVPYSGSFGILGALNLLTTVPLADSVPDYLSPYVGTSLTTVVSTSLSLGASAYTGIVFNVTDSFGFYVQTGPAVTLLPEPSIDFAGSVLFGTIFYF